MATTLHYKLYTKRFNGIDMVSKTQTFYNIKDVYDYIKHNNPDKWLINELVYDTRFVDSHNWGWDD